MYCSGSRINSFYFVKRDKRQNALHRQWSHHYVVVPYRKHICRVGKTHFSATCIDKLGLYFSTTHTK